MKRSSIAFLTCLLAFAACERPDIEKGTPRCIKTEIRKKLNKNPCPTGVYVEEYIFQGATVYLLSDGDCGSHAAIVVVDPDCNYKGNLNGSTGNTRINGEEFSNATFVRTTWEK